MTTHVGRSGPAGTGESLSQRTERTWIARLVAHAAPEIVPTETDFLISIHSAQPAFLVFVNPAHAAAASAADVAGLVARAQQERGKWPVCRIGRAAVVEFNDAWGVPALVDDLSVLLVRHQLGGPVPTLLPRSRFTRALHTMRVWLRTLMAASHDTAAATPVADLPAPGTAPVMARVPETDATEPVASTAWAAGTGRP